MNMVALAAIATIFLDDPFYYLRNAQQVNQAAERLIRKLEDTGVVSRFDGCYGSPPLQQRLPHGGSTPADYTEHGAGVVEQSTSQPSRPACLTRYSAASAAA